MIFSIMRLTCLSILTLSFTTFAESFKDQISQFRERLLSMPIDTFVMPIDKTYPLTLMAPKLGPFPSVIPELYNLPITLLGSGQDSAVFLATSSIDRSEIGLKAGDKLAVRAARIETSQERSSAERTLRNFYRAQTTLRNPSNPIVDFFPYFFGSYETSQQGKYVTKYHNDGRANVQEMEAVDNTIQAHYQCNSTGYPTEKPIIPDEVVFEFCLGEWAGVYFANIGSGDAKTENWGVKNVDHARIYRIGDKEFALPKGMVPMRIDIGGAGDFSLTFNPNDNGDANVRFGADNPRPTYICSLSQKTSKFSYGRSCRISQEANKFMEDLRSLKETEGDVFNVFQKFYDQFKGALTPILDDDGKKEFIWPL